MLAVTRPEWRKLLLHSASPPGGVAPRWINAVIEPRSPGQLPVVELADLAALALRRCYERLEAGGSPSVSDAAALMRLAWQIEHDEAIAGLDRARADLAKDVQAFRTTLWTVRKHFWTLDSQPQFAAFMADLRTKLEQILGPSAATRGC